MASFTLNQVTAIGSAYTQGVERGGYIYVPRYSGGSFAGSVDKVDMATNTVSATLDLGVFSAAGGGFSISIDSNNDLIVTDQDGSANTSGGAIHKINSSDVVTAFIWGITNFRSWITFWCNGFYYSFGTDSGAATTLYQITTGASKSVVSVSNIGNCQSGVAIGNNIYVTSDGQNNIYKFDTNAQTFTSFATGTGATGAVSARGGVLYYSRNGQGYTVNLTTGAMTLVDTLTTGKELNLIWASNSYIYSVTTSAGLNKSTTTYGALGGGTNSNFFNFM